MQKDIIKKEECPKFFVFNVFNTLISIISLLAWLFVNIRIEWKIYSIILIIVILLVVNTIIYYRNVRKFYNKYVQLYNHDNYIQELYQTNREESDKMREHNDYLKYILQDVLKLLYVYNDCGEEKRNEIRENIFNNFFSGFTRKDDKNEKRI